MLEYDDDIIVVDCGMGFPGDDMPGIDLVLPDFTYLEENSHKLRGVFLTHGHEDHIGAVPYLLKKMNVPIYGTKLTLGIVENKLVEHKLNFVPELNRVEVGATIHAGVFSVEFIRVNHSIADACCFAIRTPVGTVIHSGDFKLDMTPVDGHTMDLPRLSALGDEGVLLLMCESTNVERPGYTPSEKTVGKALDAIFQQNKRKRIVVATFSSNVHRVQQIIDKSAQNGRKVVVTGRSMLNIVKAATTLGYMKFPFGVLIDVDDMGRYKPDQLTIITTGSQGEHMSALHRMAHGEHDKIKLGSDDLVILSASPIPGNEKTVDSVINELLRRNISVHQDESIDVHVSGHACREEIKLMHTLVRPQYFMPVHGEFKHLMRHKELAEEMGMAPNHIFVAENGRTVEFTAKGAAFGNNIPAAHIMVDGIGIGDVGGIVLRDRKMLSEDGVVIISAVVDEQLVEIINGPEIISRGFVYMRDADDLMAEMKEVVRRSLEQELDNGVRDNNFTVKSPLRQQISKFIYSKTKRQPVILTAIMYI